MTSQEGSRPECVCPRAESEQLRSERDGLEEEMSSKRPCR